VRAKRRGENQRTFLPNTRGEKCWGVKDRREKGSKEGHEKNAKAKIATNGAKKTGVGGYQAKKKKQEKKQKTGDGRKRERVGRGEESLVGFSLKNKSKVND